ncbi:MAG: gliding motility protein GldM, partial [Bacteroidaceae bacterium]|nr:gliding motility protein GldM [Bacteroidaceae bacterium]
MKIKKQKVSPRQKMINLMYVLLMAMLAMNVSSDVLNGFSLVDESLTRSTENTSAQNKTLYKSFDEMMEKNPEKVRMWFERASSVKAKSDSLCHFADELKIRIAKAADGEDADYKNLENREDLEASTFVMLSADKQGEKLHKAINEYREFMMGIVDSPAEKEMIANSLSTKEQSNVLNKNWQEYHFESMPAITAITLLTKIQNDV